MLRYLFPALLLALLIGGCGNKNDDNGTADSFLQIRTAGGTIISSPTSRGAVTLTVGEQRDLRIWRTVNENGAVQPVETNVTADIDANFSEPTVASLDVSGKLSALTVGFTELELVFRDGDTDPTDDDKVFLDVTVIAAP